MQGGNYSVTHYQPECQSTIVELAKQHGHTDSGEENRRTDRMTRPKSFWGLHRQLAEELLELHHWDWPAAFLDDPPEMQEKCRREIAEREADHRTNSRRADICAIMAVGRMPVSSDPYSEFNTEAENRFGAKQAGWGENDPPRSSVQRMKLQIRAVGRAIGADRAWQPFERDSTGVTVMAAGPEATVTLYQYNGDGKWVTIDFVDGSEEAEAEFWQRLEESVSEQPALAKEAERLTISEAFEKYAHRAA